LEAESNNAAGRIRSDEKSNDLIGNRTHDLPACSTVPQATTLPRAHNQICTILWVEEELFKEEITGKTKGKCKEKEGRIEAER
jgi:hypothetical protein